MQDTITNDLQSELDRPLQVAVDDWPDLARSIERVKTLFRTRLSAAMPSGQ
jgi:hypothetical protein